MKKYHFSENERFIMEKCRIPFAIYQFLDKRVVTRILSDGFLELFGFKDREHAHYVMDNNMYVDTHPDDVGRIADAAFRFATEGGKYEVIYRSKDQNGSGYRIIHAMGEHLETEDGCRLAQVWYTDEGPCLDENDIKEVNLNEALNNALLKESILKVNYYDHLTGLPSMIYFFELAVTGRDAVLEEGGRPAILYLDFSGMKGYNRKYGFAEGDSLLREFSKLLIEYFGSECCSRFGQDHFAVYTVADDIEGRIRDLFKDSSQLNNGKTLPIRVGIYLKGSETVSITMACDRAKYACDSMKNTYISCYKYYDDSMQEEVDRKQYIIDNLDRAIAEGWIKVYYQPIVRATNGRVCDEEALARWDDPEKGFLSPAAFIPVLEASRLIYKLDLYMVDQIIKKLKVQQDAGLHIVPQSVNLSRSDFDACDIVEEIRRRVDDAGIGRENLTIEITESIVGKDFDFMKEQVIRFRSLGFQVWMDDFGSGYSSLDLLQTLDFDLIKFDMQFMRQFNQGEKGKIILTELMKMATGIGMDTVCEGVETKEQVQFLREIGCSKLQGYYFAKPMPLETILERYEKGIQIGFENPDESDYYDAIGRVNLYDLAVVTHEDEDAFKNFFNTLPMAIMEIKDRKVRFIRSNQSYRDFMLRKFSFDISDSNYSEFRNAPQGVKESYLEAVRQCCQTGNRAFIEGSTPNGSSLHSFIRRIAVNPLTDTAAVAIVILSLMDENQGTTYMNIARAMATDYFNLFYVDLDTEAFIEYRSNVGEDQMEVERHGEDFFKASQRDARLLLYKDDQDKFIESFTKENIIKTLESQGTFNLNYRLKYNEKGEESPIFAEMKIMRMRSGGNHIAIGVRSIDSQKRQEKVLERLRQEQIIYSRIMALSGDYFCIYSVDPETGHYTEYSTSDAYKKLGVKESGDDFFVQCMIEGRRVVYPEDFPIYQSRLTRENVLSEIKERGKFGLRYRLEFEDKLVNVILKAVLCTDDDGQTLIVGVRNSIEGEE